MRAVDRLTGGQTLPWGRELWTPGVSRCFSQACEKSNEFIFKAKFIRAEESSAGSFSEHPPASIPSHSPTLLGAEHPPASVRSHCPPSSEQSTPQHLSAAIAHPSQSAHPSRSRAPPPSIGLEPSPTLLGAEHPPASILRHRPPREHGNGGLACLSTPSACTFFSYF